MTLVNYSTLHKFLEKKKIENLNELNRQTKQDNTPKTKEEAPKKSESKLSYEEQKEQNKKIKRLEKQIAGFEEQIEKLEEELAQLEEKLSTPEGAADTSLYESHGQLKKKIDDTMQEWEACNEELENLKQQ